MKNSTFCNVIFLLVTIFCFDAKAEWLCTKESSYRDNNLIMVCGVSDSSNEGNARKQALENAYTELDQICSKSPDCDSFELVIKPLRTDCKKLKKGYKCYRGVEAIITDRKRDKTERRAYGDNLFIPVKKKITQEEFDESVGRTLVEFSTSPSSAKVYIDGIEVCNTPCSREVQKGRRTIVFKKLDYDTKKIKINLKSKKELINVDLKDSYSYIVLEGIPRGSTVKIDDMAVKKSKIRVLPGKHVVVIENDNFQPFSKDVDLRKGEEEVVTFGGDQLFGFIEVSVKNKKGNNVSAEIYIDGKNTGKTSPTRVKVAAGSHRLEVRRGNERDGKSIKISVNKKIEVNLILRPFRHKNIGYIPMVGICDMMDVHFDSKMDGMGYAVNQNLNRNQISKINGKSTYQYTFTFNMLCPGCGFFTSSSKISGADCQALEFEESNFSRATEEVKKFVALNINKIERDIVTGSGNNIDRVAYLYGCKNTNEFTKNIRSHFIKSINYQKDSKQIILDYIINMGERICLDS